jgi:hypothetical protein
MLVIGSLSTPSSSLATTQLWHYKAIFVEMRGFVFMLARLSAIWLKSKS